MSLAKNTIVSAWCSPTCDRTSLWGKLDQLESALHGAKIFSSMGINYSIICSYYTSDYWQPGALVSFFNYIPGLLFPKKIM